MILKSAIDEFRFSRARTGWIAGLALAILLGWVPAQAAGTGTLDQVSGWYPLGTSLTIHALPGNNSVFAAWLGDTNGATQAGPQITLAVNSSLSVTGLFSSFPNANTQPRPAPSLIVSGKSLILIVTNGVPNGGWVLLQSSNLQLPLNQWQTNGTGTYDGSGNLATNLVNTVTHPAGFYILKF